MTEREVYKKFIKPWCHDKGVFIERIEIPHLPDTYMAKNGNSLWGEIKCINSKKKILYPNWRPGQLAWIKMNECFGNNNICLILYYCGKLYFLPPKQSYTQEELVCQRNQYLTLLQK